VIVDRLGQIWNGLLGFTAIFVTPDWKDPVSWLPVLLLVGVVGPLLTVMALGWMRYDVRRPRVRATFADPRRGAALDADGRPVYPAGEPYSPGEQMIYEPGAVRSLSGEELVVGCPKCGLVRRAAIDRCGNCGLSFTLKPTTRSLRRAGPPPGGAAAA
jgi:hypothetical protein